MGSRAYKSLGMSVKALLELCEEYDADVDMPPEAPYAIFDLEESDFDGFLEELNLPKREDIY